MPVETRETKVPTHLVLELARPVVCHLIKAGHQGLHVGELQVGFNSVGIMGQLELNVWWCMRGRAEVKEYSVGTSIISFSSVVEKCL